MTEVMRPYMTDDIPDDRQCTREPLPGREHYQHEFASGRRCPNRTGEPGADTCDEHMKALGWRILTQEEANEWAEWELSVAARQAKETPTSMDRRTSDD
jgi:hypothetical protein